MKRNELIYYIKGKIDGLKDVVVFLQQPEQQEPTPIEIPQEDKPKKKSGRPKKVWDCETGDVTMQSE